MISFEGGEMDLLPGCVAFKKKKMLEKRMPRRIVRLMLPARIPLTI